MQISDEDQLRYYWEELAYLRKMGENFARAYPKVAARLELESDVCPDPHVERLIESFAFLTGRIQHALDQDFPEIAAELVSILHPHFVNPVPSMTIARFEVDPDRGKLTDGYVVPKHTPLFTHAAQGATCRFRTCYPVTLWPVAITEAAFVPPDQYDFLDFAGEVATVLKLRIESTADPLSELELASLRFYLHGEQILTGKLHELLFNHVLRVVTLADGDTARPRYLTKDSIRPVGFGLDEEVLPYPHYAQPAYRLLQEYFVFPSKFRFFDVDNLELQAADRSFDLLILLDQLPPKRFAVDTETFSLGCTPVINLFAKTSEPVRVDHRRLSYPLRADSRRSKTTEIHSIRSVVGASEGGETREYQPFYSFDHEMERKQRRAFWTARRIPDPRSDVAGTEVLLSFLDLDFRPSLPPSETVFAHTLCTNRALAEQLPAEALLQTDEAIPVSRIVCLKKPTRQFTPPLGGQTLWRLISHLSLNYLSMTDHDDSLQALHEILRLYCVSDTASAHKQVNGIRKMSQRKVVRRMGSEAWRGFVRGTEVTLTFDESLYAGSSAFLLASVLNHFLALYASTNSFTQLRIESLQRDGDWKLWPPMVGEKIIL